MKHSVMVGLYAMALGFAAPSAEAQTTRCEVFPPGGYVGVFADSLAQDSVIVLSPFSGAWVGEFYIGAILNGAVSSGISAAQFRIQLPNAAQPVFLSPSWNPEIYVRIGDPFAVGTDEGGVIVAFSSCQQGHLLPDGRRFVSLARVEVAVLAPFDTPMLVQKRSDYDFRAPCAIFARCDATFSPAPMVVLGTDESGEDYVFQGRMLCDVPVGTSSQSWSALKALYR